MRPSTPRPAEAGFSLIELLVAMVIVVEILVAALTVFDVHNKMTSVQMQITEVQQSIRVAQYDLVRTTRHAGRGILNNPFTPVVTGSSNWFTSPAIAVRNNLVDDVDRDVAQGYANSPRVWPGTDLLVVRGCISGLVFQVMQGDFDSDPAGMGTPGAIDEGTLVLRKETSNQRQQDLSELLVPGFNLPLVLQSATNRTQYAVAEVNAVAGSIDSVTFNLDFLPGDDVPANPMVGLPSLDMNVSFVCALEEYRYYVRENYLVPGDDASTPMPRLARARMIPGTETPHDSQLTNLSLDLADDIIDLQVALAFDTDYDLDGNPPGASGDDNDAIGNDDQVYEGADDDLRAIDDWLFNSTSDNPTEAQYAVNALTPGRPVRLLFARITTVGRSANPDTGYMAPDIDPVAGHDWVEDNDYDANPARMWTQGVHRNHRRRILQTTVDLRNM